jgi:hypothetical protein
MCLPVPPPGHAFILAPVLERSQDYGVPTIIAHRYVQDRRVHCQLDTGNVGYVPDLGHYPAV